MTATELLTAIRSAGKEKNLSGYALAKITRLAPKAKTSYTATRRNEVIVKNGFAGTARDHARGFDGIE